MSTPVCFMVDVELSGDSGKNVLVAFCMKCQHSYPPVIDNCPDCGLILLPAIKEIEVSAS